MNVLILLFFATFATAAQYIGINDKTYYYPAVPEAFPIDLGYVLPDNFFVRIYGKFVSADEGKELYIAFSNEDGFYAEFRIRTPIYPDNMANFSTVSCLESELNHNDQMGFRCRQHISPLIPDTLDSVRQIPFYEGDQFEMVLCFNRYYAVFNYNSRQYFDADIKRASEIPPIKQMWLGGFHWIDYVTVHDNRVGYKRCADL